MKSNFIVIGAGPAGLACGYELTRLMPGNRQNTIVLEKNALPGGLARTSTFRGRMYDIGPHRFYTKNMEVLRLWKKLLGRDFRKVKRHTRIFYKGKYFHYPLDLWDVIINIGFIESLKCLISYAGARIAYRGKESKTFEDWVVGHFGRRLYEMFFQSYTEKVWGIPCKEIAAKWASQRIKNLDFKELLMTALHIRKTPNAKSLVKEFYYPKKGAGQMYRKIAEVIRQKNGKVSLRSSVTRMRVKGNVIAAVTYTNAGKAYTVPATEVFSSMPITSCIEALSPPPPKEVLLASRSLRYRDHITVNLLVKGNDIFPDQWIYIHDKQVKAARIANYNNFSDRQSSLKQSALSVEYFVFRTDSLWRAKDDDLIAFATTELQRIGLLRPGAVIDGFVVREPDSYPMYFVGYESHFATVSRYLSSIRNLHLIGRGGMYKYNNMDHSMIDGLISARNMVKSGKMKQKETHDYLE